MRGKLVHVQPKVQIHDDVMPRLLNRYDMTHHLFVTIVGQISVLPTRHQHMHVVDEVMDPDLYTYNCVMYSFEHIVGNKVIHARVGGSSQYIYILCLIPPDDLGDTRARSVHVRFR